MLRDHEVLHSPLQVDLEQQEDHPTPDAWTNSIDESHVSVLPIVDDRDETYRDGWCTYTYEHVQAPELEVVCGGINAKTPKAGAIWRQGFILHFGFEPSPAQLNDNGRSLLINSISYVSRFRADRPIVRTPSPSYSSVRFSDRDRIARLIANESRSLETYLKHYLTSKTMLQIDGLDRAQLATWYEVNRPFLIANKEGKLMIDEIAKGFGVGVDDPGFFELAVQALSEGGARSQPARDLLHRYAPQGPGFGGSKEAWTTWLRTNGDYLFFTDTGGCCWLVDPLAKTRNVASRSLRGPNRAE